MRAQDFIRSVQGLKTYMVKIKLKQPGYTNLVDTTVQARTPEMARKIIRAQYNNSNVVVGQPKEIKSR
jgi:hypothetical protein